MIPSNINRGIEALCSSTWNTFGSRSRGGIVIARFNNLHVGVLRPLTDWLERFKAMLGHLTVAGDDLLYLTGPDLKIDMLKLVWKVMGAEEKAYLSDARQLEVDFLHSWWVGLPKCFSKSLRVKTLITCCCAPLKTPLPCYLRIECYTAALRPVLEDLDKLNCYIKTNGRPLRTMPDKVVDHLNLSESLPELPPSV